MRHFAGALFACGLAAAPARAQQSDPGPSLLIVRYATRSSFAMYSGYQAHAWLAFAGMLSNPRSEYREILGGIGRPISLGGSSLTLATAMAWTNTGWYSELYLLPNVRVGALTVSATVEGVQPFSSAGTRGVYLSPGNALVALGKGFSTGFGVYASAEQGNSSTLGIGPAFQRAVPKGSVTLELIKGVRAAADELRLTVRSSF